MNRIRIPAAGLALTILAFVIGAGKAAAEGTALAQLSSLVVERAAIPAAPTARAVRHDGHGEPGYPDDQGRQEAVRACMKASFDSEKRTCIQAANSARYFDPSAARACGDMSFGSNIGPCLIAVANKTYLSDEVTLCRDNSFDSGKIDCFRNAGRSYEARPPYYPRPDLDSYILEGLRRIRSDLERGRIPSAIMELANLIQFIEQGMDGRPYR